MGPDHPPGPAYAGVMGRARRSQLGNVHLGTETLTYERLQELGRMLTQKIALAELDRDWDRVDVLLREKNELNRMLKEAQCRLT